MNLTANKQRINQIPAYCLRYGWHDDPFHISADKAPYFIPAHWDQLLDVIQKTYQQENALIIIKGKPGTGKSIFLQQILRQIDSNTLTCVVSATKDFTLNSLLDVLCTNFQVAQPSREALEDQFDDLLEAIQLVTQSCLLIIDNAHLLRHDVLQQVLIFVEQQTDYQMRLHTILLGTPEIKTTIETIANTRPKPSTIYLLNLRPFNANETADYVKHRIKTIDNNSQSPLTHETVHYIHHQAKGIPHHINRIANHVLNTGKIIKPAKQLHINYKLVNIISLSTFFLTLFIGLFSIFKTDLFHLHTIAAKTTVVKPAILAASLNSNEQAVLHENNEKLTANPLVETQTLLTKNHINTVKVTNVIAPTTPPIKAIIIKPIATVSNAPSLSTLNKTIKTKPATEITKIAPTSVTTKIIKVNPFATVTSTAAISAHTKTIKAKPITVVKNTVPTSVTFKSIKIKPISAVNNEASTPTAKNIKVKPIVVTANNIKPAVATTAATVKKNPIVKISTTHLPANTAQTNKLKEVVVKPANNQQTINTVNAAIINKTSPAPKIITAILTTNQPTIGASNTITTTSTNKKSVTNTSTHKTKKNIVKTKKAGKKNHAHIIKTNAQLKKLNNEITDETLPLLNNPSVGMDTTSSDVTAATNSSNSDATNKSKNTSVNPKSFPQNDNNATLLAKLKNKTSNIHFKKPDFKLKKLDLF